MLLKGLKKKAEKFDGNAIQEDCVFAGQYTGLVVGAGGRGVGSIFKGLLQGLGSNTLAEAQSKRSAHKDTQDETTSDNV